MNFIILCYNISKINIYLKLTTEALNENLTNPLPNKCQVHIKVSEIKSSIRTQESRPSILQIHTVDHCPLAVSWEF